VLSRFALLASVVSASVTCPDGWTPSGSNCFRVSPSSGLGDSPNMASACSPGALASVLDATENSGAISVITAAGTADYWLGATKIGATIGDTTSAAWQWDDGSAWSYQGFANGEPNQAMNQDCLIIRQKVGDGKHQGWMDWPCDNYGRGAKYGVCKVAGTTSTPPPSPSVIAASQGDPHLSLAHGGRADFRGHHGSTYNFLSTFSLSVNVRMANTSFHLRPPPTYANITVHGTMITEAYIVVRTARGRWLNVTYSAEKVQGDHARRDVVTASCSSQAASAEPLSVQPGQVHPCDENLLYLGFSTLEVNHIPSGDSWKIKIKSMPVYDRISGAHHRLDLSFVPTTPEAQLVSMPHGIIGQSWDGDGRAVDGALDEYPQTEGAIFTTHAMAEGAIEGTPSDYEVSYPYDVSFKHSRFGKRGLSARSTSRLASSLIESAAKEGTASSSAGASGDRFPRHPHVEL